MAPNGINGQGKPRLPDSKAPSRGLLHEGHAADRLLFDPATIMDRSTYNNPQQYPAGIGTVIVNGPIVIDGGGAHRRSAGTAAQAAGSSAGVRRMRPAGIACRS